MMGDERWEMGIFSSCGEDVSKALVVGLSLSLSLSLSHSDRVLCVVEGLFTVG